MFSVRSQNSQPQASLQSKRECFRSQIRRQQLHEYKNKIRLRLVFDNEPDANILKNIILTEVMSIILNYEFPRKKNSHGDDVSIDECQLMYDIEKPQNGTIFKAIEGLFLHATSSNHAHVANIMQERHIFILAEILDRKMTEMKPLFKEKSYREGKRANDLKLPPIYERIALILAQCAFSESLFFEESIHYIVNVINGLLSVFPRQTQIVVACVHMIGVSLHNKMLKNHLLFSLSEKQEKQCLLTQLSNVKLFILQIFANEVKYFDSSSEHSSKVITSFLHFYYQLFIQLTINDLYPTMRKTIYKQLTELTLKENLNIQIRFGIARVISSLYSSDFGLVSQIVLETPDLFDWILEQLEKIVKSFKGKKEKDNINQKVSLSIICLNILKTVFYAPDPTDELYSQIARYLFEQYEQKIDLLLQDLLKIPTNPIISNTLQLIKIITNWGDLIEKIYQNGNIVAKLFYYCTNEAIDVKKQAICCLCNMIEGYFDGNHYHDSTLCDIYDHLIENKFFDIMVDNLDKHYDIEMNVDILRSIRILCYFWQSDPQLGKHNRFWANFAQNGGQLKLNTIISSDRNQQMKELATEILDNFVMTEEHEFQI